MQVQAGKQEKGSINLYNFGIGKLMPGSKNVVAVEVGKTVKQLSQNGGGTKQRKARGDGTGRQMQREGEGRGRHHVVEGRKSVSHVEESNVASVAAFLHVKVVSSDMPDFMKVHAFRCARRTYDGLDKFSSKHMAYTMKKLREHWILIPNRTGPAQPV